MSKEKSKELEELFDSWIKKQDKESASGKVITKVDSDLIGNDFFCKDGIINEEIFNKEKTKVLFISNEANIEKYENSKEHMDRNKCFLSYSNGDGKDEWGGKMKERLCELYSIVVGENDNIIPKQKRAEHFAFMNINKRGGAENVGNDDHILNYFIYYNNEISKEIEIINPDIIVWLGCNTYDNCLKRKLCFEGKKVNNQFRYIEKNGNKYYVTDTKEIPIVRMWHTSYYQAKNTPLDGYENKTVGKLCAKLKNELKRFK